MQSLLYICMLDVPLILTSHHLSNQILSDSLLAYLLNDLVRYLMSRLDLGGAAACGSFSSTDDPLLGGFLGGDLLTGISSCVITIYTHIHI